MNFKTLVAGITFFQEQLKKFIEKSNKQNDIDVERINGIKAKINDRNLEITQATKLHNNIQKLFDDDDTNDDILDTPLKSE